MSEPDHTAILYFVDPALKDFAETQLIKDIVDAANAAGSYRGADSALGLANDHARRTIRRLEAKAAVQGYAPRHDMTHTAPSPFVVKGVSTLYNIPGQPLQWVKTRLDDQLYLEQLREAARAFAEDSVTPVTPPPGPTGEVEKDIIPWIQIGDAHLGMLAHEAETGENFDLKIAERELCAAISILIDELGPHERIVLNDLGDFTHYENFSGTTEHSGHALDYDSRFPKMIKTYSRVMRFMVDKLLEKAQHVDVIINQGNHSRTNDIWMAELLRVGYAHTGRVHVLNNDSVFIGYRMGNTLVMVHHSDKCRPANLTGVMITDYRKDFGETEYHYIDIGHIHHNMVSKEYPSVQIESFNQLAAGDKYAHDNGYRSRQSISMIFRSRTYGEVGRRVLPIRRVRDIIHNALKVAGKKTVARPTSKVPFTV